MKAGAKHMNFQCGTGMTAIGLNKCLVVPEPLRHNPKVKVILLLMLLLGLSGLPFAQEDSALARFNHLSELLVCQCGCNQTLASCSMLNCHSATPMRAIIKEEIAKGTSDEAILAKFERQYGKVVLASPPTEGFDLTAWVMPFLVLAAGSVVAYLVAVRMKRAKTAAPAVAVVAGAAQLPAAYNSAIEKELESFEERE
jgi:cytochrome c-type biogenesis protein CcmH/NrfF